MQLWPSASQVPLEKMTVALFKVSQQWLAFRTKQKVKSSGLQDTLLFVVISERHGVFFFSVSVGRAQVNKSGHLHPSWNKMPVQEFYCLDVALYVYIFCHQPMKSTYRGFVIIGFWSILVLVVMILKTACPLLQDNQARFSTPNDCKTCPTFTLDRSDYLPRLSFPRSPETNTEFLTLN